MARVSQKLVEVDDSIEFSAAADPVVYLLTHSFFLDSKKVIGGAVCESSKNEFSNGEFVVPMTRIPLWWARVMSWR
jgi:hypothetical protein